jgi:hypothetical protein
MKIIEVARLCHQANKALCESHEDYSQPDWPYAPAWQKDSAVNGVKFHIRNPGASASASHTNWMMEKIEAGWTYGPQKDAIAKQHPCMVPFEALPAEQRAKDHLFRAIVHAMAPFIDQEELDEVRS